MAEQSFESHAHHPTPTLRAGVLGVTALVLIMRHCLRLAYARLAIVAAIGRLRAGCDQRAVHRQAAGPHHHARDEDSCAELLPAGQDAQLAKFSKKQIVALRFASDEEFGALLERAARENLSPKDIKAVDQDLASRFASHREGGRVTPEEQQEVRRLIDAHEHTLQVCRACAETTRDLAWEVKRGSVPSPEALAATLAEVERVLDELGKVEIAIAEMKAALW